jgi:large subunit ribosomal protein L4
VGGGQAHKPVPRDYTQKMPRKMRRLALRSALSAKTAAAELIILDKLVLEAPKTAEVVKLLKTLQISGSAVILLPEQNENVEKSARNLENVKTLRAGYLNVRDLLGHTYVIMPKEAVSLIESFLG